MDTDVVDTLRQPEYTGENRCEPCTVLNLAIAMILGSAIARKSKLGGIIGFGISVGLIYLRGYLVPGTPTFTKRYLPAEVLRWFGKDPEPELATGFADIKTGNNASPDNKAAVESTGGMKADGEMATDNVPTNGHDTSADEQPPSEEDLELFFTKHGILEPCSDSDDLCLTDTFQTAWLDEIDSLNTTEITASLIADTIGIETEDREFELTEQGEARILLTNDQTVSQWPSKAALLADIAACRVLRSEIADWSKYKIEKKGQILNSLRMFIETCPTTGGDIQMGEEIVESCCSSQKVVTVTCEESGERLFEHPLPESDVEEQPS
ncbi:hypothetical protein Harman_38830 [Haloarcula mannanilytica]|uniref:Uncharacterized protein n=1 Tax=Haloarcula mannanilytica TaxID=2509225 RepID=A0A4C2EMY2_9EURY|nr:hypothetical protein [Haloarcula mannanilytica]GCF15948.1 hypothetical protein Harman_38830 [Haloarcula mannanilytica]